MGYKPLSVDHGQEERFPETPSTNVNGEINTNCINNLSSDSQHEKLLEILIKILKRIQINTRTCLFIKYLCELLMSVLKEPKKLRNIKSQQSNKLNNNYDRNVSPIEMWTMLNELTSYIFKELEPLSHHLDEHSDLNKIKQKHGAELELMAKTGISSLHPRGNSSIEWMYELFFEQVSDEEVKSARPSKTKASKQKETFTKRLKWLNEIANINYVWTNLLTTTELIRRGLFDSLTKMKRIQKGHVTEDEMKNDQLKHSVVKSTEAVANHKRTQQTNVTVENPINDQQSPDVENVEANAIESNPLLPPVETAIPEVDIVLETSPDNFNKDSLIDTQPPSLISSGRLASETDDKKITIKILSEEYTSLQPHSETFSSLTLQVLKHHIPPHQAQIVACFIKFDATLRENRKRFKTNRDRLATFSSTQRYLDVSVIEAASAGFVARKAIEPESNFNTALLCLECCLQLDNLPKDIVVIAVHKACSESCNFIMTIEQQNSSDDDVAVAIPDSRVNGDGNLSNLVVPGMVTKPNQAFDESRETGDLRRKYDLTVLNSSKLLPIPKDDLVKGWTQTELLDTLPEDSGVFSILDIAPTIGSLSPMTNEETRRQSFQTYPNHLLLNIAQLVAVGFFWTGKGNIMRCCGCGVEHSDWERNVSPFTRHLQISKNCVFLKRSFTPEYLSNTSEVLKTGPAYTPPSLIARKEKVTKRDVALYIDTRAYSSIRDNPEKFGLERTIRKKLTSELYKSVEYLRKYNLPVPAREPEVVEMLMKAREREKKETESKWPMTKTHVMEEVSHHFDSNLQKEALELERKQKTLKAPDQPEQQQLALTQDVSAAELAQSMRCKICLDKLCALLLLPCCHIATCAGCGMSQAMCPICRSKVTATTSIRFF